MLARCILQDVDVLLLDEPTNHLDIAGIQFLEGLCQMWNKAMICISHDRRFIETVFDTYVEIDQQKIEKFQGSYDQFQTHKRQREEAQLRQYEAQERFLKQQDRFIERFRYKASKASQVQSRVKMLDKMDMVDAPAAQKSQDVQIATVGKLPHTLVTLSGCEM